MRTNIVALKLYRRTYKELLALAKDVYAGFSAAVAVYTSPNPGLPTLAAAITSLDAAINAWGEPENRGPHKALVTLRDERGKMRIILSQLANYAETTTPGDVRNLTSIGWPLRATHQPAIRLGPVRNLEQFFTRRQPMVGKIKLRWHKPLGTEHLRINGYQVMRGTTSDFNDAVTVGWSSKLFFVDDNPGSGERFYWVIPYNAVGAGDHSDLCSARAIGI